MTPKLRKVCLLWSNKVVRNFYRSYTDGRSLIDAAAGQQVQAVAAGPAAPSCQRSGKTRTTESFGQRIERFREVFLERFRDFATNIFKIFKNN